MSTDAIGNLDKRIAELQARRDRLRARERERDRKRDVRRKIILGGALLAQARSGDAACTGIVPVLLAALTERDAKAFDGWVLADGGEGQAASPREDET